MVTIRIEGKTAENEYKVYGSIADVHRMVLREFNDVSVLIHKCMKSNSITIVKG